MMTKLLSILLAAICGALFAAGTAAQGVPPVPPLCVCSQTANSWPLAYRNRVTNGATSTTTCNVGVLSCSIAGTLTFNPHSNPYPGMNAYWSAPQFLTPYALSIGTDGQTQACANGVPLSSWITIWYNPGGGLTSYGATATWMCNSQ